MSKVKSFNHIDTAISGFVSNNLALPPVNFGADFRVSDQTAEQLSITNLRSPIGAPETFLSVYTPIRDVYKSTTIEPSYRAVNKSGVKLFFSHKDVQSVTETADVTFRVDSPWSFSLAVTVPATEWTTADDVKNYIVRSLTILFDDGVNTSAKLEAALRGVLINASMK